MSQKPGPTRGHDEQADRLIADTLPVRTVESGPTEPATSWNRAPPLDERSFGEDLQSRYAIAGPAPPGEVCDAFDRRMGRDVVLRTRGAGPAGDGRDALLLAAVRVRALLEHPGIPPVYDVGVDASGTAYVTERRAGGRSLADILAEPTREAHDVATPSLRELVENLADACKAVEYAHARGVAHSDLTADCVLVGDFGETYVTGWDGAHLPAGGDDVGADLEALRRMLARLADVGTEHEKSALDAIAEHPYESVAALRTALERWLERDRDAERRREKAGECARAAAVETARALKGSDPEGEARARALRMIGRALALDPVDAQAAASLEELLDSAPRHLPPEVAQRVADDAHALLKEEARLAGIALLTWFAYVPLVLGHLRAPWVYAAVSACFLASALASFAVARHPARHLRAGATHVLTGMLAVGASAAAYGPFVVTPLLAVALTAALLIAHPDPRDRPKIIAACCLAIVVPAGLEYAQLIPPAYVFDGGALRIVPWMVELPPAVAALLIHVTHAVLLLVLVPWALRIRKRLNDAEKSTHLRAWQLRQLIEHDGGPVPEAPLSTRSVPAPQVAPSMRFVATNDVRRATSERYDRRRRLGEGGMGEVWLAADLRIGREVALKTVLPARAPSGEACASFISEARLQARLEHPAIVPVYDQARRADGVPFFTMRRIHGKTLEEHIGELRRDPSAGPAVRNRLLSLFCGVCRAVHYAHGRGVLHRDLKPGNVMVGSQGEVYVLDWGIAKSGPAPLADLFAEAPTAAATLGAGTLGFMAPEQLRPNVGPIDERTDVYALGAILFELLSLEPLHSGSSVAQIVRSTLEGPDGRPSRRNAALDVPPELDAICMRATALCPSDRFASAGDLCGAVEDFLEGRRDLERRREAARDLAESASLAAARALALGGAGLEDRRVALRDVHRALALDPSNTVAGSVFVHLLTHPPADDPPEVREALVASARLQQSKAARWLACAYLTWFLYVPLILLLGVRQPAALAVTSGAMMLAAILSLRLARRPHPTAKVPYSVLAANALAVASLSLILGPFFFVPIAAAALTVGYLLKAETSRRVAVVAMGLAGLLLPLLGERVFGSSSGFDGGAILVFPRMNMLPRGFMFLALTLGHVGAIVTVGVWFGRFRDALSDASRRAHLHAWQLRQLAP